jgi:hypothetical protein
MHMLPLKLTRFGTILSIHRNLVTILSNPKTKFYEYGPRSR